MVRHRPLKLRSEGAFAQVSTLRDLDRGHYRSDLGIK